MASQNSASDVAAMVAVKTEYDADTDSDEEQHQQPNEKANRDDNEHEKYIAEIRKITDQLLSPGQLDGAKLEQVNRIAHDLESFSKELKTSVKDVETEFCQLAEKYMAKIRKSTDKLLSLSRRDGAKSKQVHRIAHDLESFTDELTKMLKNGAVVKTEYDADTDSDEQKQQPNKKAKREDKHEKYLAKIREITDQLLSLGLHSTIRDIAYALESFLKELKEELLGQRALEESWQQFERKNGLMVWARDNDNPNAQQHLAYLCSGYNGPDDGDHVWIRWDSDIGKRVRVAESRIEDLEEAYSKIYAWCDYEHRAATYEEISMNRHKLNMLPYDRFLFWRNLLECETWGDIKAMSDEEDIKMLKDRYMEKVKYDWDCAYNVWEDDERHINNVMKDDTVIDFADFSLYSFPPLTEVLMHDELWETEGWVRKYGKVKSWGLGDFYTFEIDNEEREAIFNDMEKRELVAIYCPQMRDIFGSYSYIF